MKLLQIKKFLDSLTPEQLTQDLLYKSDDHSISGVVTGIRKSKSNLYWDGECDPSRLMTINEIKKEGLDIGDFEIEIKKGDIYIDIS